MSVPGFDNSAVYDSNSSSTVWIVGVEGVSGFNADLAVGTKTFFLICGVGFVGGTGAGALAAGPCTSGVGAIFCRYSVI